MADLPCPTCGSALTFLDQYHRHYCHHCGQYAPEGYGDRGAKQCPTCGGILSYVPQYDRFYCYRCNAYPPEEPAPQPKAEAPSAAVAPAETPPTPAQSTPAPEATPVVAASPVPSLPSPQPSPQLSSENPTPPAADASPQTPVAEPATPSAPTAIAEVKAAEPSPAGPSREMQALAAAKPAAVRVKLFALKKPELIDLCKVYNLDPSGTKEQLQERLLSYLHDLEAEEEPEPEEPAPVEHAVSETSVSAAPPSDSANPAIEETVEEGATPATAQTSVLVEETKPERVASAQPTAPLVAAAPTVVEVPHVAPKAEHPCPTCGRELTFISQYNRSYCYYCQRYAPVGAGAKNACPTCGTTMRWIGQHRRWWCDSCQKYASAELPPPGGAAPVEAAMAPAAAAVHVRAIVVHRHGSPAGGAGLVGLGIALYVVYAFFTYLGAVLGIVTPVGITPEVLSLLQFFAFLFVALGAIVGLYGLRDRE